MKRWILVAFLSLPLFAGASTAYLRPTTDTGAGSTGVGGCNTASYDTTQPLEGVYGASYSGKSGAGPTGSSAAATVAYTDVSGQAWDQDRFGYDGTTYGHWQTPPAGTLTGASLNISISKATAGTGTPTFCVYYTTNSGSTWTNMGTVTGTQSTLTVTGITGISALGIMIGCQTSTSSNSTCTPTVYDVWLTWNYTPTSTGYMLPVVDAGWMLPLLFDEKWRKTLA